MRTKLYEGENIIYIAKKHWVVYLSAVLIFILGFIFANYFKEKLIILVGIAVFIWVHIERAKHLWIVTNRRIILEYGIFILNTKETPIDKLNNISIKKDILGMIFGYGTVFIQSAAEMGLTTAKWIAKPEAFVDAVIKAQNTVYQEGIENYMECPYCKEIIKKGAVKCRFCGSILEQSQPVMSYNNTENSLKTEIQENFETREKEKINETKEEIKDAFKRKADIWRPGRQETKKGGE